MALLGTLQVRMGLDTASFGQKFNSFTKDLEKRASAFSKGLSGLTNFGSLLGGAGIGAALTQGIRVAGDFESTINQVAAAADLGADAIAGLSKIALDFSKGTVFSANQAAEAMLALAKAGITPAEQAAGSLTATMQLAATEGLELSFAAEVVANTMGAFGLAAKDSASIVDALAGASIASTASVQGLALSLSQVSAVAKLNGSNLNDVAGTLALFAQRGIQGSDAGTSLKTMFLSLVPKTKAARNTMEAYGISFVNANGSMRSLTQIAEILQRRLGGLTEAQRTSALQAMFGTDAYRAAAILAQEGAAGLQKYIAATHDKNAAEKLSEARTKGFAGAMLRLKNSLSNLAIELGNGGFLKALTDLTNKASEFVAKLSTLPQWAKNTAVGFAVAAAALPPLALAIASIAAAVPAVLTAGGALVGFFAGPWGLALVAAVGLAVLFKDRIIATSNSLRIWFRNWVDNNQLLLAEFGLAWEGLGASFANLWGTMVSGFSRVGAAIIAAFGVSTSDVVSQFGYSFGVTMQGIVLLVEGVVRSLTEFVNDIAFAVEKAVAGALLIGNAFSAAFKVVTGVFASIGQLVTTFAATVANAFTVKIPEAVNAMMQATERGLTAMKQGFADFATAAANVVIAGMNKAIGAVDALVNTASSGITKFLEMANKVPGVDLGTFSYSQTSASIPSFSRFPVEAVDFGRLDVEESGAAEYLKELSRLFEQFAAENFSGAGTDLAQALDAFHEIMAPMASPAIGGDNPFSKWSEGATGLAESLKKAAIEAGGLIGNIDPTSAGGASGGKSSSGKGGVVGALDKMKKKTEESKTAFEKWVESIQKGAIQVQSVWTSAMGHIGSAIDDFVKTGKLNFSDLVRSIIADIASAALKNAVNGLLKSLLGITGLGASGGTAAGGSGGGWLSGLGSIFGSILGGFGSFEGGGYTGDGARSGGLDGRGGRLAMIHPRETVIDHTRVKKSARPGPAGGIHVSTPITLMPGVSKEELAEILPMLKRDIIETIPELIAQGGRYAGAYGQ